MPPQRRQYTEDDGNAICEMIMDGMPLSRVCEQPGMPCRSTVVKWLNEYPVFAAQYARAREVQADKIADEIIHIADTEPDAQIARNRIDARKWMAGKMRPSRYGDRVEVEHSGQIDQGVKVILSFGPAPQPQALDVSPIASPVPLPTECAISSTTKAIGMQDEHDDAVDNGNDGG